MEFQEYQRRADTTLLESLRRNLIERLTKLNLWGPRELAEATDEYLKTSTKGHRDENESGMDIEHFVEELGDCFWCVSEICRDYNIPLQQVAQENLIKISKRYNKSNDINTDVNTFGKYEEEARKTIKEKYRTIDEQTQQKAKIEISLNGIVRELGIFASEVSKQVIGFYADEVLEPNSEMLKEKAGDTLWYMMLACNTVGYSLEQMVQMNLAKLQERYGSQTVKVQEKTGTQSQDQGLEIGD